MRAITVYRWVYDSDAIYRRRHPIGSLLELRKYERGNNYNDLLRLARRLFASDTADAVRIVIDIDHAPTYLPEPALDVARVGPD